MFRKLPFGTNYKSDFFYLSKSSDDWNCVFIELERPQAKFFKPKSNELTDEFLAGLNQIDTWRAWFLNAANRQFFVRDRALARAVLLACVVLGRECG